MVDNNLCPVCGYMMAEPPCDYNICPSCGTEFGLHDWNATFEDLRNAWLKTGPKWWSTSDEQPSNWNPMMQLANLLLGHARIPVYFNTYSLGNTISQAAVADLGQKKYAYTPAESLCR